MCRAKCKGKNTPYQKREVVRAQKFPPPLGTQLYFITKCDRYSNIITKCNKRLLQNVSAFSLQNALGLLQNATTKSVDFIIKYDNYYKMRQCTPQGNLPFTAVSSDSSALQDQWTDFYMIGTSLMKELNSNISTKICY